jgi:hypothetical protein
MQALLQRQQPCACTQLRPTARAARVRYTCAAGSSAQAVTSHASQLQQVPSSRRTVLEGILAVVAATAWGLQSPGAAAAAGGPRDLTPEQQEAVNRALAKVVTKAKVCPCCLSVLYLYSSSLTAESVSHSGTSSCATFTTFRSLLRTTAAIVSTGPCTML